MRTKSLLGVMKRIDQTMTTAGDGAQGIVYVQQGADAHVSNVANQSGQIVAIDGQTGVYGSISDVASSSGYNPPDTWGFSRTR